MTRRRQFVQTVLLAAITGHALAVEFSGPQRNLVVELRWVDVAVGPGAQEDMTAQGRGTGTPGSVSSRSPGAISSRGSDGVGAIQRVLVLNGHPASVSLGLQTPVQWFDYSVGLGAATTKAGSQRPGVSAGAAGAWISAEPRTAWVEQTRSFVVRPQWPGGLQPVRVELQATSPTGGAQAPGQAQVFSTVQVMLGDWLAVARSDPGNTQPLQPGVVSTRSDRPGDARELQLRITLQP